MNSKALIAIAVVLIVIVAAAAFVLTKDNGGNEKEEEPVAPLDTYYVYLAGFDEAVDGWHVSKADCATCGLEAALEGGSIEYTIDNGKISAIAGKQASEDGTIGFTAYEYAVADLSLAWVGSYMAWPEPNVAKMVNNIICITYGELAGASNMTLPDAAIKGGPFDDKDYKMPAMGDTYYVYLDGFDDAINGWHTGTGANTLDAFKNAMDNDKIAYEINKYNSPASIDNIVMEPTVGISVYEYPVSDFKNPSADLFFMGPTLDNIVGNVIYCSLSEFTFDEFWNAHYVLNPTTSENLFTGGPFTA